MVSASEMRESTVKCLPSPRCSSTSAESYSPTAGIEDSPPGRRTLQPGLGHARRAPRTGGRRFRNRPHQPGRIPGPHRFSTIRGRSRATNSKRTCTPSPNPIRTRWPWLRDLARSRKYLMGYAEQRVGGVERVAHPAFPSARLFHGVFHVLLSRAAQAGSADLQAGRRSHPARPGECVFVDDRPLNVESARRVGMRAIRFENAAQLRRELAALGVEL